MGRSSERSDSPLSLAAQRREQRSRFRDARNGGSDHGNKLSSWRFRRQQGRISRLQGPFRGRNGHDKQPRPCAGKRGQIYFPADLTDPVRLQESLDLLSDQIRRINKRLESESCAATQAELLVARNRLFEQVFEVTRAQVSSGGGLGSEFSVEGLCLVAEGIAKALPF